MQTKRQSMTEVCVNIVIGFVVAVLSQLLIFPMFDIHIKIYDNIQIALYFTAISLVRSYYVRRYYNWKHKREYVKN